MAKLAIYNGNAFDRHVELSERDYRIGRGDQNDIVLPDPNKAVSRLHAELCYEGGRFVVTDLNSQNGIWIEGKKVPRAALEPGQPVTVGPYRLVLEPAEATTAESAPPPAVSASPTPSPAPIPVPSSVPAESPKPAAKPPARKPMGGGRAKSIALFGGLFAILIVVGVAIGLWWPSGQSSPRPVDLVNQPGASEPTAEAGAAPGSDQDPAAQAATAGAAAGVGQVAAGAPAAAEVTEPAKPAEAVAPPARRPAPTKPAPAATDPSVPARRPGESTTAWRSRTRQVQTWYTQGTASLRGGDFAAAVERFEAIMKEAPGYRDVPALLDDARRNLQALAQSMFEEGLALETNGAYVEAMRAIRRALQIDPGIEGAGAVTARITERMREAGEEAFKRARQYDALGRKAEAIEQYERALQLLPPDHESRKMAKERLDALKGGIQ